MTIKIKKTLGYIFRLKLLPSRKSSAWLAARSDLQVCAHGTGSGNMGIILKQLRRLGIRSWDELASAKKHLGWFELS